MKTDKRWHWKCISPILIILTHMDISLPASYFQRTCFSQTVLSTFPPLLPLLPLPPNSPWNLPPGSSPVTSVLAMTQLHLCCWNSWLFNHSTSTTLSSSWKQTFAKLFIFLFGVMKKAQGLTLAGGNLKTDSTWVSRGPRLTGHNQGFFDYLDSF